MIKKYIKDNLNGKYHIKDLQNLAKDCAEYTEGMHSKKRAKRILCHYAKVKEGKIVFSTKGKKDRKMTFDILSAEFEKHYDGSDSDSDSDSIDSDTSSDNDDKYNKKSKKSSSSSNHGFLRLDFLNKTIAMDSDNESMCYKLKSGIEGTCTNILN